jgi:amidase
VTQLHDLTALEQAAVVRAKDVSPTELVEHALDRIAALDAGLGARAVSCRRCSASRRRSRT